MMVILLGGWQQDHHPRMVRMVTIILLSAAPNPFVGFPTLHKDRTVVLPLYQYLHAKSYNFEGFIGSKLEAYRALKSSNLVVGF